MIRKTSLLRDRSDVPCGQAWDDMHRGVCRDAGDCAAREIVISPAARSDLLFTMSENPRAASATREVRYFRTSHPAGGARRDRTDDLLLAKQALSQLSYGPAARNACQSVPEAKAGLPSRSSRQHSPAFAFRLRRGSLRFASASEGWWAWEDLNFRPHAYQARALTN